MVFKQFISDGIEIERGSLDFSFWWLSDWADPHKNILFYFILFYLHVEPKFLGFGYGFENSKAYYGSRGLYTGPDSSASPAHRLGHDIWFQKLR